MGIDLVEFQSLFSLGWTSFANVFLVYFLKEYFYDNQDHWAVKPIAIGAASVLPCVMIMYVIGGPAVIFLILHLIISFPLYLYQFIKSRAIVKMLEKEEEVDILVLKGFKYVGLSGLAMFLTLVFLIFNEVTLVFPDFFMSIGLLKEDASIFVGIGVIFGGLAAIFYYIGFIMPEWIRNRWLQQAEQKK